MILVHEMRADEEHDGTPLFSVIYDATKLHAKDVIHRHFNQGVPHTAACSDGPQHRTSLDSCLRSCLRPNALPTSRFAARPVPIDCYARKPSCSLAVRSRGPDHG